MRKDRRVGGGAGSSPSPSPLASLRSWPDPCGRWSPIISPSQMTRPQRQTPTTGGGPNRTKPKCISPQVNRVGHFNFWAVGRDKISPQDRKEFGNSGLCLSASVYVRKKKSVRRSSTRLLKPHFSHSLSTSYADYVCKKKIGWRKI